MATATDTTTDRLIEGYIIRYDSLSNPWDMQGGKMLYERFAKGAFADSVSEIISGIKKIKVNVEHGRDNALLQIGSTESNVELEHRDDGVYMRMRLIDDSLSDDLYKKIKANFVNGLSIEFKKYPGEEPAYESFDRNYVRTYRRAMLDGFAIVAEPRYEDSKVFARSINDNDLSLIAGEVAAHERLKIAVLEAYLYGVRL
jgi:HK97 family phage prohead protease